MFLGFTEEQIRRYSRQIVLPGVGGKGQKKLMKAKVFLVGAGALGSPAAIYLAAAGVGRLGICDSDTVDLSNLQRQILHHTHDLGKPKVVSAAEAIAEINPDVEVIQHQVRLCSDNILDIIADYDIVVEGSDNFPTKYLVNDACFLAGKPDVHAGILRFEGQLAVFIRGKGCLRCIWPEPPPPDMVPSCQEAGVLGALPGIIGGLQATEVIKLILGLGTPLAGELLAFNALDMEFHRARRTRRHDCALCGDSPTIKGLIDYEQFCGIEPERCQTQMSSSEAQWAER
jgi:molybdopterin/thiamine biosynthesis adenylyltransferase